jgi:ribonuclease HI
LHFSGAQHKSFKKADDAYKFVAQYTVCDFIDLETDFKSSRRTKAPPRKRRGRPTFRLPIFHDVGALTTAVSPPTVPNSHSSPKPKHKRKRCRLDDEAVRRKYDIPSDAETIYTDGACTRNGKSGAKAGIGVFFTLNDPRNVSARLPGHRQTNQRAELFAVLRALETLHLNRSSCDRKRVVILSDSKYVVNALTDWVLRWESCGWKTLDGKNVISKDLFKRVRDMLGELTENHIIVKFVQVPGHRGIWGNEQADELAVKGSQMDQIRDPQWNKEFDDEELDLLITEMQEYDDDKLDIMIAEMDDLVWAQTGQV